ncbi:hypothetical protein OROGR_000641 [Orobanche gracilis]
MWMVDGHDHNHHGKEMKISADDPMFVRKLRPLMPRPISSCAAKSIPFSTVSTPPCFCTSHHQNPNFIPNWSHSIVVVVGLFDVAQSYVIVRVVTRSHQVGILICMTYVFVGGMSDYGFKREIHTMPLVSTRWNPTSEQLQALEEMYRRGTRTPSAEQIQQIAARLRRFGKIEGKNIFYWFQNHKARERQKKRRQIELLAGKKVLHSESTSETKQTGFGRKNFETENHKKLATPSNCCSTPSEDTVSMHGSVMVSECKKLDVWAELQQQQLTAKNEITSWKLDLSSFCHNPTNYNTNPIIIKENRTTLELFPTGPSDLNHDNQQDQVQDVSRVCLENIKCRPKNEFIEFLPITKK